MRREYDGVRLQQVVSSVNMLLRESGRKRWCVDTLRNGKRDVTVALYPDMGLAPQYHRFTGKWAQREAYYYLTGFRTLLVQLIEQQRR